MQASYPANPSLVRSLERRRLIPEAPSLRFGV